MSDTAGLGPALKHVLTPSKPTLVDIVFQNLQESKAHGSESIAWAASYLKKDGLMRN